jgi:hypothetical protein
VSFSVVNQGDGQARTTRHMLLFMMRRATKKLRSLFVALAVTAIVATSCGGSSGDTAGAAPAPAEEADQAAPIEEATAQPSRVATTVTGGQIASAPAEEADQAAPIEEATAEPSRVATTVTGGQIDFGSFEGQDVVLWFWAPW